ncbi:MAG: hypothetical protein ACRD04_03290 [Terriglobales bacterium]
MSLPSPTPAPAGAGPLALFRLRRAHRRHARSLAGSLRAVLNAESGRLPNYPDFAAFLDQLHIPHQSARRIAFPDSSTSNSLGPPSSFDAIFRDQTLTIRLRPKHRAILELCADNILLDHSPLRRACRPGGYDFGAIAASALHRHTGGLAREEMDDFLRRYPSANVPDWCSQLSSVFVPSSASETRPPGARPQDAAPYPPPSEIPNLWPDLRQASRDQRQASRNLRPHLAELAELLLRKHQELAHPGRSGAFHAWLKANDIPRQSAYRLLKINDLSCTKCDPARPADLELHPRFALFRLSPRDSALAHRVLSDARKRSRPRDFSSLLAGAFIEQLSPGRAYSTALAWFNQPDSDFPAPSSRKPIPLYFNRPPDPPRSRHPSLSSIDDKSDSGGFGGSLGQPQHAYVGLAEQGGEVGGFGAGAIVVESGDVEPAEMAPDALDGKAEFLHRPFVAGPG